MKIARIVIVPFVLLATAITVGGAAQKPLSAPINRAAYCCDVCPPLCPNPPNPPGQTQ